MTTTLAGGSAGVAAIAAAITVANPTAVSTALNSVVSAANASAPAAVTDIDAARLAKQATFGPTPAVIARIKQLGINGWLDEQFAAKTTSYADLKAMAVANNYCDTTGKAIPNCFFIYRDSMLPAMRFYKSAVANDDQLRQRVAFALLNIMPVSGLKVKDTAGLAAYEQLLLDNAFGNFGDLLKAVVLSGAMADYLDLGGSNKAAPNENMARELLQLFSIGPDQLVANGNPRLDSTGATLPNYTQKDITEIARALTGWDYPHFPGWKANQTGVNNLSLPLIQNPTAFDTGAKTFLGTTVPAGASQQANVDALIKRLMTDPSISPRITKLLIQALVKSNPSSDYINRASSAFRNNGSGVTGDMKAVIRAILTDREARTPDTSTTGGKLKDPVMLALSLARTIGTNTDGYAFTIRDVQMGEQYLKAPSVFGDCPPDFPLAAPSKLVSPSSKLMTVGTILQRHNFIWQWTMSADNVRTEFTAPTWVPNTSPTTQNWADWESFGTNVDGMIDRINLIMLNNSMTTAQRTSLKTAMMLVTDPSPAVQARHRAQTGIFIVASSPQFQIDR